MKPILSKLIPLLLIFSISPVLAEEAIPTQAAVAESCDCPKLECDTCHEEKGVTFYSEKCGPGGNRVRSCARPTCALLDPAPTNCAQVKKDVAPSPTPRAEKAVVETETNRQTASVPAAEKVGAVLIVKGSAVVRGADGQTQKVTGGMPIRTTDIIETQTDGEVQVQFDDGNQINVQSNSKLRVQQYDANPQKPDRRAILDLMHGKVRSKVKQKYDGQNSFYQIKTKAAVAGVRGTDFVVSYVISDKIETRIETLEGKVVLSSADKKQSVDVSAGEGASFLVAANESGVFNEDDINDFVARGYMTPVYKMSAADLRKLDEDTGFGSGGSRAIASAKKEQAVCKEPKAQYNQCLWSCLNNPKGESRCRTDLPEVSCVRKRCDANGKWSDESRLPASYHEACKPQGHKVSPCDY